MADSAAIDDRGLYRIYGLPPGDYMISASPFIAGSNDSRVMTDAELAWAAQQTQPGALNRTDGAAPARGRPVTTAPVYYPGTTDIAAAELVSVGPHAERDGINMSLQFVPTAKVEGVIVDPNGQPPVQVQANLIRPSQPFFMAPPQFIRPDANGKSSMTGVKPGDYVLAARGLAQPRPGDERVRSDAPAGITGGAVTPPLWAMVNLSVTGEDISGLVVTLQPGMNMSGKIVFDGTAAPPADLTAVRINLTAAGNSGLSLGVPAVAAHADGSFVISGVAPGTYRLMAGLPAGVTSPWALRSAVVEGRDSQDYPVAIAAGQDLTGAVITFTDRPSEIRGALLDAAGQPARGYVILAFSKDKTFWVPNSRRVKSVRPATNGTYALMGLPPGDYYLSALTDVQPAQLNDPSFLDSLVPASIVVSLGDSEKKAQDIRLAGG